MAAVHGCGSAGFRCHVTSVGLCWLCWGGLGVLSSFCYLLHF